MEMDKDLKRDLKTLARFIELYCRKKHGDADRRAAHLKTHDIDAIASSPVLLCADCTKLLMHSFAKRSNCPLEPKPACKHCPEHCYHPDYRARIREVMRYSGRRLVLSGRLDYLFKLLS